MIEEDLVPWMLTNPNATVEAVVTFTDGRIHYGNAPEFEDDNVTRYQPPYVILEGPVASDRTRFSDGSSLRYCCLLRFQAFGYDMTWVAKVLHLLDIALSPIQDINLPNTYVQSFIRGPLYVDNRRLQRGKQERTPDSSEDPLAEGHIDFDVWSSHRPIGN